MKYAITIGLDTVHDSIPDNLLDSTIDYHETNSLALTIRKNYSLSILKNSVTTTLRISTKIAFSTFMLNFLKFLF